MVDEGTLDILRAALRQSPVRIPGHHDRVYKEECMFSFDTAFSPGGLYLNLGTWQSFGEQFVGLDQERSSNKLYLYEKAQKVPLPAEEVDARPEKLAIGGDGGFQVGGDKDIEKQQWLVVLPENIRVKLPAPELPDMILNALAEIAIHDSAQVQDETAAWEEERKESKYATDLPLLQEGEGKFGRTIPSNSALWECDETSVKENLWLNLSTGFIGSGRQNWDGSGGNGSAVRHYHNTGKKYPLAVKLGTITPSGADVFSYAEDDMVTDPKLAEHLAHWGINMMAMQKTEKTMAELQIDLNMSYEFDRITESGSALQPLSGPGYVGLKNLGNSCYMNSVLQLLWTVPGVQQRYAGAANAIFKSAPSDPGSDLPTQMAKVGVALCEARTGEPATSTSADEGNEDPMLIDEAALGQAVKPQSFKSLVGKGHPEFSSSRQQDASEFFQYLLELISRTERVNAGRLGQPSAPSTAVAFEFGVETRVQCGESRKVSYKRDAPCNILSLNIPIDAAANRDEVEEYQEREAKRTKLKESNADAYIQQDGAPEGTSFISRSTQEEKVLPRVPLSACLQRWQADEEMGDYFSAALGRKTSALKHQRFASFPPFLLVQLNRYYLADDWTSRKLEVLVDVPEKLYLEPLRGKGVQPGEELQPELPSTPGQTGAEAAAAAEELQPDPEIVTALMSMGFSENGSKRAAVATQNGGTEASMEWVLSHMEDPDFNDPLPAAVPATSSAAESAFTADPDSLAMLSSMGFEQRQATAALKACSGSLERAADWLFSHAASLDKDVDKILQPAATANGRETKTAEGKAEAQIEDGEGKYRLVGFISHMGANTACGHYVCHLSKAGRWVIYNDEKVAVSEHPPKELGYLYLFQREDTM